MTAEFAPAILYVDDEPINVRVFEANFRIRFRVVSCSSGEEALALLSEREGEFGVVLSDQRMPGMTGVELLEQVRLRWPDVQRMLLTAYSDMQVVLAALNRGQVSRYFVKPWVREELASALEDACRIYSLQARLRDTELRMLRSERLAAIGAVSAGIAHELMNPLGWVTQNLSSLERELGQLTAYASRHLATDPDPKVAELVADLPGLLKDVEEGASHLREVVVGVRRQSVTAEEPLTPVDLAEVVSFARKISHSQVRQRARIVLDGAPLEVMGNRAPLTQVLLNLIVNAAHAMAEGRPGLITVRWAPDGEDHARLVVEDNGSGIPADALEKVFDRFFTTKKAGEGTGLGLPISRELVRQMGGELTLRSKVGEGTQVELRLRRPPKAG